jgi:hypothetical protein
MLLFVTRGKVLKNGQLIVNSIKRLFENNYSGKIIKGHGDRYDLDPKMKNIRHLLGYEFVLGLKYSRIWNQE